MASEADTELAAVDIEAGAGVVAARTMQTVSPKRINERRDNMIIYISSILQNQLCTGDKDHGYFITMTSFLCLSNLPNSHRFR